MMSDHGDARFHTTMWSMVLRAGTADGKPQQVALEQLCRLYWRPLHVYCLGQRRSKADADDLTQGFFAYFLAKNALRVADPNRGRFRSFLLTSFKNFMAGEADRLGAIRRGGGVVHLSFDIDLNESSLLPIASENSPEMAYDRQWAHDLVARATEQLREEMIAAGKIRWFELVAGQQAGTPYSAIALEVGTTEEAVKSFAKRMRKRFREILEVNVADTVDSPEALAEEMAYLAELLRK